VGVDAPVFEAEAGASSEAAVIVDDAAEALPAVALRNCSELFEEGTLAPGFRN